MNYGILKMLNIPLLRISRNEEVFCLLSKTRTMPLFLSLKQDDAEFFDYCLSMTM